MQETGETSCCGPTCCAEPQAEGRRVVGAEEIVERVRERYGLIAAESEPGCCGLVSGGPGPGAELAKELGYDAAQLAEVPKESNLGLGCGAPLRHLAPAPGETVLDLGSGPGLDALLAARQVGAEGRVIGVDMTPAMLARARASAAKLGLWHVEFREGRLEALPVASGSVDAVTSNCVINLVPDKAAVFAEVARVLRPGGRLVISDILLDGELPEAIREDLLAWVGCVAGALRREVYFGLLGAAGLRDVEVLKDVDYLAALAATAPEEVRRLEDRTGVRLAEVAGRVRSVTFRARRPSAGATGLTGQP